MCRIGFMYVRLLLSPIALDQGRHEPIPWRVVGGPSSSPESSGNKPVNPQLDNRLPKTRHRKGLGRDN